MSSEKFGFILMAIVFGGGSLVALSAGVFFLLRQGVLFGLGS